MSEMTCRWAGSDRPRLLRTHLAGCEDRCDGCQPCPERHCQVCGRTHVTSEGRGTDQTCADCLGVARDDLGLIADMSARMLAEAMRRSVNSDAAMLAGPAADYETWQRRRRLIVDAAVFADEGSDEHRRLVALAEDCRDEKHPLWVLGTWDFLVREHLDQPTDERVTVAKSAAYLDGHLTRLAHDEGFDFAELSRDLRGCRGYLEDVLSEGEREERGAPCPTCGRSALVKHYGDTEADDRWTCPRCGQWWTERDYRAKVAGTYVAVADALTASQIAATYRVPEGSVRSWAVLRPGEERPRVRKRGRDQHGIQLYDVADVLAMRDRRDTA